MANSKKRCACCKEYFKAEIMIKKGPASYCSKECMFNTGKKAKRQTIKSHFARKESEMTVQQEREWLARIDRYAKEHGTFPSGLREKYERHHIYGRTFRHNKTHLGRLLVLPMSIEYHNNDNNSEKKSVTNFKKEFERIFGLQELMWLQMVNEIKEEDGSLPFGDEILELVEELIR